MNRARKSGRWVVATVAIVGAALGMLGCGRVDDSWPAKPGPRVMVTLPALYSFTANVAGEDAAVQCLLTSANPHDFEPTHHDYAKIHGANLFFINGLGLDDQFAGKLIDSAGNRRLRLVTLAESIPVKDLRDSGQHCCELATQDPNHKCTHHHGKYDPHVWIGIPEAIRMVQRIRDELSQADPAHAAGYKARASAYIAKLEKLHQEGKAALAGKKDRRIIAFHDSLQYFARTFDLHIVATVEPRCGMEPDPNHLARLVQLCKEQKVGLIAVEQDVSNRSAAHTLLTELRRPVHGVPDAEFVVVDPLETAPAGEKLTPDYYERKMRANIDNLAKALR